MVLLAGTTAREGFGVLAMRESQDFEGTRESRMAEWEVHGRGSGRDEAGEVGRRQRGRTPWTQVQKGTLYWR